MSTPPLPSDELRSRVEALAPWWEQIDFGPGIRTGPGRNKDILWRDYLSRSLKPEDITGRSVLDMGCNAGGHLQVLSRFNPSRLVGIDYHPTFLAQARFVQEHFALDCEIRQYEFLPTTRWQQHAEALGSFDVIFCLGIIYHLSRETNLQMLRYMRHHGGRAFCSTQLFGVDSRTAVDWEVSKEGTLALVREAGYSGVGEIYTKTDSDNWSGLTNQWYFELLP